MHRRGPSRTTRVVARCSTPVASVVLAWLALLAPACGSDDGGAGTGGDGAGGSGADDVSFATTVQPLFDRACNCHQSTPLMAPFSLMAADAYDNIVGVPASQLPSMNLVTPGKLNESYLWHKLDGTQLEVGGSGARMPSNIPLDQDQKDVVARWIAAGAPP